MVPNEIGYGALHLILREVSEGSFPDLITEEVVEAFREVLSPKEAWSVAGILQDAIGAKFAAEGKAGIAERTTPFGRDG